MTAARQDPTLKLAEPPAQASQKAEAHPEAPKATPEATPKAKARPRLQPTAQALTQAQTPAQRQDAGPPASGERLHGLPPVVDARTRVLILGSFPGARSLAEQRYYAHPHNQFWRLLHMNLAAAPAESAVPADYAERLHAMRAWGVGVWDVYASCLRAGSLDSAIREPQLNDFVALARSLPQLAGIAFNGGESWKHHGLVQAQLDLPMWRLPSSSPAHASWTVQRKAEAWRAVFVQAGLIKGA